MNKVQFLKFDKIKYNTVNKVCFGNTANPEASLRRKTPLERPRTSQCSLKLKVQVLTPMRSNPYRRNQISAMLADSQCIVGNISQAPGSARTIFAQFGEKYPGTSPLMHRESANLADI